MLSRTTLALLLTAVLTTAQAAIELPPMPHESTCEGFTFKELLFKDGKREIVYQLPSQWSFRSRPDGVQLTPPKVSFAEAIIRVAPLLVLQPLDEKGIEAAKQAFLGSLPPGSQVVSIVNEERNPVLLDNKPSYELTATYQVLGETFLRSALFTNVSNAQVSFSLTARKSDFEALHRIFRQSILSWSWRESTESTASNETAVAAGPAPEAPARTN